MDWFKLIQTRTDSNGFKMIQKVKCSNTDYFEWLQIDSAMFNAVTQTGLNGFKLIQI